MSYIKHMGLLSQAYSDLEIDYDNAVTCSNNTAYVPEQAGVFCAQGTASNDQASLEVAATRDGVTVPIRNQSIARGGSNGLRASIVVGKGDTCRATAVNCTGISVMFYPFK